MEEGSEEGLTFKKWLKNNLITILLGVGALLGYGVAEICLNVADNKYKSRTIMCVGFPGELLSNALECMSMPLAVSGVILAVTSLKRKKFSVIFLHTFIYSLLFKIEATVLGVIFGSWIAPTKLHEVKDGEKEVRKQQGNVTSTDYYLDIFRRLFPSNVITMTMMHHKTELKPKDNATDLYDWEVSKYGTMEGGANIFGMICYSIFFAAALGTLLDKGNTLRQMFETLYKMCIMITRWLLIITPFFGISLVASSVLEARFSPRSIPPRITGGLIGAIVGAHAVQCLIVYPLIYFSLTWENPFKPILPYFDAIMAAFIIRSHHKTLPITLLSLERRGKVPPTLAKCVIPITQAINQDGAAIYFTIAAIFMYRTYDIPIGIFDLFMICTLGCLSSFVSSGIPNSYFLCVVMMLDILGQPIYNVPLLVTVGWIVERTANVVNLFADFYLVRLLSIYNSKKFLDT